jgi:RNA polymerase sigma-70 factor (ECF subfamily)
VAPSLGATVGHAAALAEAAGAEAGLAQLDALAGAATYQPAWALRAHLLARLGRGAEASAAYAQAMGLSEDKAVREFLAARQAETG